VRLFVFQLQNSSLKSTIMAARVQSGGNPVKKVPIHLQVSRILD